MSLLRKSALAMVIPAAAALMVTGAGSAAAAPDLYGAIAVRTKGVGAAADYRTQKEADAAAIKACGDPALCTVMARFYNQCGAVSERDIAWPLGTSPLYWAGTGATAADAHRNAMFMAGNEPISVPGVWWVARPAFVLDTICTSNAG
ncbi:DUF4189 domain-containing protein [Nocardia sp. XZ_19_385]|uniref:DUF4189 domain-containing protein n=1 Tax=Nocardia sp. XZ_19_385 TaxID=2769488 RepID=UPI00188E6588|nr:DUF4189 domain-containing protein [Nocardia sp. XZ_19_385]